MSARITRSDMASAVANHERALRLYGLLPVEHKLYLAIGSKTNGNAWGMYVIRPGESGHYEPPIGYADLSTDIREAYTTLTSMTRAVHDVMYHLKQQGRLT